jgi:hypothetical protein
MLPCLASRDCVARRGISRAPLPDERAALDERVGRGLEDFARVGQPPTARRCCWLLERRGSEGSPTATGPEHRRERARRSLSLVLTDREAEPEARRRDQPASILPISSRTPPTQRDVIAAAVYVAAPRLCSERPLGGARRATPFADRPQATSAALCRRTMMLPRPRRVASRFTRAVASSHPSRSS